MKRKMLILLLAMMVLVATLVPGGLVAADEVGVVYPFAPGLHQFDVGQPFQIGWMWFATTKGLVNVYYQHWESSSALYDESGNLVWSLPAEESADYFQPIEVRDLEELPFASDWICPRPYLYTTDWWSEEIVLNEPGMYTLWLSIAVTNPINDGVHTCTDANGDPVSLPPSLLQPFEIEFPVPIEILPAP